jgi:D-alanine-D-alanine ligase
MQKKIIILGGGTSSEREISLVTSSTIKSALDSLGVESILIDPADFNDLGECVLYLKQQQPDLVFIGLHGAAGEDGRLQAMLELLKIPYTGSGSHASCLSMDKNAALCLARELRIPVAPHLLLKFDSKASEKEIVGITGFPLVVKPNSSGSSVGITIVNDRSQLFSAITAAREEDDSILCEKYIPGREITVTILGSRALPVVEIKPQKGWYDYLNKYTAGNTKYICPADLPHEATALVQSYAEKIFRQLGCQVYSRIDFRYDNEQFYFLEVNTLPGMTALSLTPMAAKAAGYNLGALLQEIIRLSINKYKD